MTLGVVETVSLSAGHDFSKEVCSEIVLLAGLGVEGDAHLGVTVQHRSRVAKDPTQPNLRQVHLIHAELLDELRHKGFVVAPADMGENLTTRGVDLLALPRGARLHLGDSAVIEVTGLRNPCKQINDFQPGLMQAVLDYDADGQLIRKAGVMAIVIEGGVVTPGTNIRIVLPEGPFEPLAAV
ncbi:MOSC domain-containing protein [Rhizobium sp.]|uniref:MOSC domain-containing protein n=1 Tax=Rhizobium sp. TaxID=391 RepID=UPI002AA5E75A